MIVKNPYKSISKNRSSIRVIKESVGELPDSVVDKFITTLPVRKLDSKTGHTLLSRDEWERI